eukprot:1445838-Pyramimonas_sp.AAC.1
MTRSYGPACRASAPRRNVMRIRKLYSSPSCRRVVVDSGIGTAVGPSAAFAPRAWRRPEQQQWQQPETNVQTPSRAAISLPGGIPSARIPGGTIDIK